MNWMRSRGLYPLPVCQSFLVGNVVEVGEGVTVHRVGDRVGIG